MAELVGHVPDVWQGVRLEVILLQELEGVLAQQLKGDAHVTVEVEPVGHQDTQAGGEEWGLRLCAGGWLPQPLPPRKPVPTPSQAPGSHSRTQKHTKTQVAAQEHILHQPSPKSTRNKD